MEIRDWFVKITVQVRDGGVEALDTFQLPEMTGLSVTDAEREELRKLRDYVAAEVSRIVNRRCVMFVSHMS